MIVTTTQSKKKHFDSFFYVIVWKCYNCINKKSLVEGIELYDVGRYVLFYFLIYFNIFGIVCAALTL